MEGKNHEQSMRELKDKFWFTYKVRILNSAIVSVE